MPGSWVFGLLAWLATHLVALTLLGFFGAAMWLFGPLQPGSEHFAPAPDMMQAPDPVGLRPLSTAFRSADASIAPGARHLDATAADATDAASVEQPTATSGLPVGSPMRESFTTTQKAQLPAETPRPGNQWRDGRLSIGSLLIEVPRDDGIFRPATDMPIPARLDEHSLRQAARRAFWNGELQAAELDYLDLLDASADDPDLYGELGNLYHQMGRDELALDAYYAAGRLLRNRGGGAKLEQVRAILDRHGDPRSDELAR